jgi:hypothetical protein
MSYKKPEVVPVASAITSIQGGKASGLPRDSGHIWKDTVGAYEADE